MANLASWFKRLTPLGGQGADGAVQGVAEVITDASKNPSAEQQQVASVDAVKANRSGKS